MLETIAPESLGFTDKEICSKILIVPEEVVWGDNFIPPKKFYIINSLGMGIYFKTNNRLTAQKLADKMYGKNFFRVRKAMKASVR